MCGRAIQSSELLTYAIVDGINVRDSRLHNHPPRWNAAPSQELLVIRRNHKTGEVSLDPLRWGLIPNWCNDPQGGRKPIKRAGSLATNAFKMIGPHHQAREDYYLIAVALGQLGGLFRVLTNAWLLAVCELDAFAFQSRLKRRHVQKKPHGAPSQTWTA